MNKNILLVDDDRNVLSALRRALGERYSLHCAGGGDEALALVQSCGPFAAVVSDMHMPGMSGLAFLREMRRRAPQTIRLVLTGFAEFDLAMAAVNEGAVFRLHLKPIVAEELAASIDSALLRHEFEKNVGSALDPCQEIVHEVASLKTALHQGELRVYLQPQISLADGQVPCAEALVRWAHPERGLLLPGQFLATAQMAGLSGDITRWMVDSVCAEAKGWNNGGLPSVAVAVNVTAADLADPAFPPWLTETAERHGVAAARLELELTEGMAVVDTEGTAVTLQRFRDLGITLSIDDFGTGHSALGWLRSLHVDKLKIDRMFIADIADDPEACRIVETIISLAKDLRLTVLAEGIETREQLDVLKRIGCHLGQGFLLARPMPAADFPSWLAGHRP
jgi:EAL domain-containing protein (putative c-di-GMP-specific phosphodiesterase class I)/ActR/RegA family two-component response regulator